MKGRAQAWNPSSDSGGMATPPPVSRASALAPRCHSIRGLVALAPAGTNQQALQASSASQDGPWAVTSCSSGDQGGSWLLLLGISVLLPLSPVCTPPQSVFPALISPFSWKIQWRSPRSDSFHREGRGQSLVAILHTPRPSPRALEQSLDPSREDTSSPRMMFGSCKYRNLSV